METVANDSLYVVDKDLETLLSRELCERIGIIKFNKLPEEPSGQAVIRALNVDQAKLKVDPFQQSILKEFPKVFTGLGRLKDYKVHLYVNEDIPPTVQPK